MGRILTTGWAEVGLPQQRGGHRLLPKRVMPATAEWSSRSVRQLYRLGQE
jgi:hypothetical protein